MKNSSIVIIQVLLLVGNIGFFLGTHAQNASSAAQQNVISGADRQIETDPALDRMPEGQPSVAAALAAMRQEQAQLRHELQRLRGNSSIQPVAAKSDDGACQQDDDNSPGVTVYLDTSSAPADQQNVHNTAQPQTQSRQWTAVSFKEAGVAADGSKQAVMSIHKADIVVQPESPAAPRTAPRWQ